MIGIVLWNNAAENKAVIWCEDQGDLAYMSGTDHMIGLDPMIEVGDVVEFDIHTQRNLRLASNVKSVRQNSGTSLSDSLRSIPVMGDHMVSNTAKVIPFRVDHPAQGMRARHDQQKRLG